MPYFRLTWVIQFLFLYWHVCMLGFIPGYWEVIDHIYEMCQTRDPTQPTRMSNVTHGSHLFWETLPHRGLGRTRSTSNDIPWGNNAARFHESHWVRKRFIIRNVQKIQRKKMEAVMCVSTCWMGTSLEIRVIYFSGHTYTCLKNVFRELCVLGFSKLKTSCGIHLSDHFRTFWHLTVSLPKDGFNRSLLWFGQVGIMRRWWWPLCRPAARCQNWPWSDVPCSQYAGSSSSSSSSSEWCVTILSIGSNSFLKEGHWILPKTKCCRCGYKHFSGENIPTSV